MADRDASESLYRALFTGMDQAYAVVEVIPDESGNWADFRFLEVNPAFMEHTGMPYPVGRTATELLGTPNPRWAEVYGRVADTGQPVRFTEPELTLDRDFELNVFRIGGAGSRRVAVLFSDVTERTRTAAALGNTAARDAYRVALADALRTVPPADAPAVATRLLAEHLAASRVMYGVTDAGLEDWFTNQGECRLDPSMPTALGRHRWDDFGAYVATEMRTGRTLVVPDVCAHAGHGAAELAAYASVGIRSLVAVPIIRDGMVAAYLAVNQVDPRAWTAGEVALIEETTERVWSSVERARAETAVRHSEARYRHIVEAARDYAIFTTDQEGRITSWSPGAETVFGWAPAEVIGESFAMIFLPEDRAAGAPGGELAAAAEHGAAMGVRWHLTRHGRPVFVDATTRVLPDDHGRPGGFLRIGQDVTMRHALDEALAESESRYHALVDNVREHAIFLLDADGVVTEWTTGAERVLGYTSQESIGRHFSMFYTAADVAAGIPARELADAALAGSAECEGWRRRGDAARFWASEHCTAVRDRHGRVKGFSIVLRDLTLRRQADDASALMREAAERGALHRRLVLAEEEERRRLSRELHDEAGQHLTALALGLKALSDLAPPGSEIDQRATELRMVATTLGRDLHAIAVRLRPRALDDFGLDAALTAYLEEWARKSAIDVDVHMSTGPERLPAAIEGALYRIVQEALSNVARHSGATHASVLVERRDGHVIAIIEDDGHGFERAAGATVGVAPLGLMGMRERAALLGGTLEIESQPGGGSTVFVRIPTADLDVSPAGAGTRGEA